MIVLSLPYKIQASTNLVCCFHESDMLCIAQTLSIRNMNSLSNYDVIKQKWVMPYLEECAQVMLCWLHKLQYMHVACVTTDTMKCLLFIWEKQATQKYSGDHTWGHKP